MIDYLFLGATPCNEECAQLGTDNYRARARAEIRAYINMLNRVVDAAGKTTPEGCTLVSKAESHDFGSYSEAAVRFDTDNEAACDFAFWLEANTPPHWDELARQELGLQDEEVSQ